MAAWHHGTIQRRIGQRHQSKHYYRGFVYHAFHVPLTLSRHLLKGSKPRQRRPVAQHRIEGYIYQRTWEKAGLGDKLCQRVPYRTVNSLSRTQHHTMNTAAEVPPVAKPVEATPALGEDAMGGAPVDATKPAEGDKPAGGNAVPKPQLGMPAFKRRPEGR
jgi:hypothetical protein